MASETELGAETRDALLDEAAAKLEKDQRTNFRSVCLTSDLDWDKLLDIARGYFTVSEQGEFHELYQTYKRHNQKFYVHLYLYRHQDTASPILFTLNSSRDFRTTAEPMIRNSEGLYPMWLRPEELTELREEILEKEGLRLTGFDYDTFGKERRSEVERRPGRKREGSHEGDDANTVLEEMKVDYGITPTKLRFSLPTKGDFQVSNEGEFVLTQGNTQFLYSEITEPALEKAYPVNRLIQRSDLSVIKDNGPDQIHGKAIEVEIGTRLDFDDFDDLKVEMERNDFYPFSYHAAQGSLLLNGRIVDENNGGILSVSTDGETLSMLPRYESGFDSLLRFYRFIVEHIDPETTVNLVEA